MKCAGCGAALGRLNARGEPLLRCRALVLKASGVEAVCPKCSAGVPVEGELARALGRRLLVIAPRRQTRPA